MSLRPYSGHILTGSKKSEYENDPLYPPGNSEFGKSTCKENSNVISKGFKG